jgi:hypothetical protein
MPTSVLQVVVLEVLLTQHLLLLQLVQTLLPLVLVEHPGAPTELAQMDKTLLA